MVASWKMPQPLPEFTPTIKRRVAEASHSVQIASLAAGDSWEQPRARIALMGAGDGVLMGLNHEVGRVGCVCRF